MVRSMAILPSHQSAKQIVSWCFVESWKYRKVPDLKAPQYLLQMRFIHATGGFHTNGILVSRGRISIIGSNNGKARNGTECTKDSLRRVDFFHGHSLLSSLNRMISTSTSSNHIESKMQNENEDTNSSKIGSNSCKNSKGSHERIPVQNDERKPHKNSFQSMFRQYGKVFITTYMGVYVSTLLGLFMSVQSGHLDAMQLISLLSGTSAPTEPGGVADPGTIKEATMAMKDLVELLESYTLTRPVAPMVEEYPWTANFAIAWIATKFTEPIRFGVTVMVTPPIAKLFGYRSIPTVVRNGSIDEVSGKKDASYAPKSAEAAEANK